MLVEALNPKTAAFFLAFIPQFIDPAGNHPALQFMALGLISVMLNTFADVVVVMMAGPRVPVCAQPDCCNGCGKAQGYSWPGLGFRWLVRRPAS